MPPASGGDAGRMCLYLDAGLFMWVGLGSGEDILQRLGQVFKLHLLILEDLVIPNVRKWNLRTSW